MTSLKDFAKTYTGQAMKNIVELETVNAALEIKKETRKDQDNQDYTVMFIVVNNEEYRIPGSVIGQLKALITAKPDIANFKVVKTGTGMATKYQVIPL